MNIQTLPPDRRGQIQDRVFKGFHIFSNGMENTGRRDNFGALYVFNDDTMFPGAYLGMHPHSNVEVITVMIKGKESHEDNLGYKQELSKGDVQLISAGSGIRHAGGNVSQSEQARHLQIWIAPNAMNMVPAVRSKHRDANIKNEWLLQVSPDGENDSLLIKQEAWLFQGFFDKGSVSYKLKKHGNGVMVYVLDGKIELSEVTAEQNETLFITNTEDINFQVGDTASLVLIETVM